MALLQIESTMPRDGAIIFTDLTGKLDLLRVNCDKCGRAGRYGLHRLIEEHGRNATLIDWLDELTAGNTGLRTKHQCPFGQFRRARMP
jgi:hypothetical protein